MENEVVELASDPYKLHQYLLQVIHMSKKSFVVMGKALYYLKRDDLYKQAVGQGADTWEDYLRQPEIGLSRDEAGRLMQIYTIFVLKLGYDESTIAAVPIKNMHYLLPLVKKMESKDEADDLVADATLLSQKDFKERIYDAKALEMGERATRTYEYLIMRKTVETGTLEKVHDIDSDMIKRMFNLE